MIFILILTYLYIYYSISNGQITNGCDSTGKTCITFSSCGVTTSTSNSDIATITTTGIDTVEFELQFDSNSIGWIAIGISDSPSMFNAYIFLCHRTSGGGVTVQERKSDNSYNRPPTVTSNLNAISTTNSAGVLNCKFTSPITRTPQLDATAGYHILLARGTYTTNIIQHSSRCYISAKMQIADTFESISVPSSTVDPSSLPSSVESTPSVYTIIPTSTVSIINPALSTDLISATFTYSHTQSVLPSLIATLVPTSSTIPAQNTSTAIATGPPVTTPNSGTTLVTLKHTILILVLVMLIF